MAADNRVWDGVESVIAQDAVTHPSFLPPSFNAQSINRAYRGGINKTRPSFLERSFEAAADQPTGMLDRFLYGNFQGSMAYQSIKATSQDGIVCAVGGDIYFIVIQNGRAVVYFLTTGNESNLMHTWFVQAEDWVYIQNGSQNPIAWDGVLANAPIRLNPVTNQMPIGTIMAYSNGRVFVSDQFNNIYASDIIFGNGFTTTSNTQNFTETLYWQEGGSFTPPSNLGNITGMKVMPTLNLNDRGQGELVIFCDRGAFTLNTQIPRDQWKDAQIQKVSLIGRGNMSPWSLTSVNNEIFFRSDDGWSLYSNAQVDFSQKLAFRKFSREVNYWIEQDTPWMKQFASGMFFDNRFLGTVNPYTVQPREENQSAGLHRPHRGMVVLDLDHSTSPAPDASINWRWNGVWAGPQPTQLLNAYINGQERAFCFSFDADGVNRLYELQPNGRDDYANGGNVPVRSYYTTKRFDFSDSQQTNRFLRKKLTGGEMWLSDFEEEIKLSVQYRPESYPCWNDIQREVQFGCSSCTVNKGESGCELVVSNARYKRIKFSTPDSTICQLGGKIPTIVGAEFQLQVNLEGSATIDRLRICADLAGSIDLPIGDCEIEDQDCRPVSCCPVNGLDFYRIIDPSASPTGPGGIPRPPNLPPSGPPAPPEFCGLDLDSEGGDEGYNQTFAAETSPFFNLNLTVSFTTFSVTDQLIITAINGVGVETEILDSGCIATDITGIYSNSVTVPQGTTSVRFEVIPLCSGEPSGTVWILQAGCEYQAIT